MPLVGAWLVVTGLAIWKPVQLGWLTALFGGYVWARYWHFLAMPALVVARVGHVFMVFAVDPYSLRSMITGGYNEAKSPEARNARPFVNLRAAKAPRAPEPPPAPQPPGPTNEPHLAARAPSPGRRHRRRSARFLAAGLRAGGGALAALALAGCNSRGPRAAQGTLRAAERWNERVERKLFRPTARNVPSTRAAAAGLEAFRRTSSPPTMPVWDEDPRAARGTVEDLALLREGLVRLLEEGGLEVAAAVDNPSDFLRAAMTMEPDVAVVDVRLPPTFRDEGLARCDRSPPPATRLPDPRALAVRRAGLRGRASGRRRRAASATC